MRPALLGSAAMLGMALGLFASQANAITASYSYDALGRVTGVTYSDGTAITYQYDAAGNRTQQVIASGGSGSLTAVDDSVSTAVNTNANLDPRTNDLNPNGYTLDFTGTTNGSNGTVTAYSDSVTYHPNTGWTGTDTFTYSLTDHHGHAVTGTVTVTVGSTNRNPTASGDSIVTNQNTPTTFDPRSNDSDPDGDALNISAVTTPTHGTATINGGSSITYAPATGYTGSDSFSYTVADGHSGTASGTISATVQASGGNLPPTAANDVMAILQTHTLGTGYTPTKTIDPRVNDSDPDGDALTITGVTAGSTKATVTYTSTSVTYTYNTSVTGVLTDTDSFTYTISDGHSHTTTATVSVDIDVEGS